MQPLRVTTESGLARDCAREVLDAVPPVIWFLRREMRGFHKGFSLAQFRTLSLVHRQPAASLSVVAEHLGVSLPTASRLVHGLVKQGLLSRQGCADDRRQLSLAITEAGETVLDRAWSGVQGRLMDQMRNLSPLQMQSVAQAMDVFKGVFGELGVFRTNGRVNGGANGTPRV